MNEPTYAYIPTGENRPPVKGEWFIHYQFEDECQLCECHEGGESGSFPIYARTEAMELLCKVAFAELQLAYVKDYPHSMLRDEAECFAIKERFLNGERSAAWLESATSLTSRMKDAADGK